MSKFMNDIKRNFRIGIEKTEEIGKIGKLKVDILGIQHNLDKVFKELGEIAYVYLKDPRKGDLKAEKKTGDLIKKIDQYQSEIKAKEKEIQTVRKEHEASNSKPGKPEASVAVKEKSSAAPKSKPAAAKTAVKPKASANAKKAAAKSSTAKSKSSTKDAPAS